MARPLGLFAVKTPRDEGGWRWLPGLGGNRPVPLLTRLFFRRFLDNDLLGPASEMHGALAFVIALLAAPGVFNLAWLLFTYSGPFLTPSERLLLSLDHKYQFLASSMLATALGTVLAWDALSLDARDLAILGPLPLARGVLWRSKIVALLLFLALFAVAVSLIPTVGFPVVWLSLVPIGFGRALSVVGVHALASLAAAIFGFCAVLAIRSTLRLLCGPRTFAAASTAAQFVLALALIVAFLLLPAYSSNARTQLRDRPAAVFASPPLWFVGVYERLTARALYADPDLTRDSTWKFWERERLTRMYPLRKIRGLLPEAWIHPSPLFRTEEGARRRYREIQPTLDRLAGIGTVAFVAMVFAASLLYFLAHVRRRDGVDVTWAGQTAPGRPRRIGDAMLAFLAPRRAVARATFFFTAQALGRSPAHRLYVAGFVAVALAAVVFSLAPIAVAGPDAFAAPTPLLLSQQLVLAFFVLVGVRTVFAVPAALEASWLFRASDGGDAQTALSGVRHALVVRVVLPLFAALVPLHAWLWGLRVAALHFAAGVAGSLLLVHVLLFGSRRIPFTSPWVPGNGNLKATWPIFLVALVAFTQGLAMLEFLSLSSPIAFAIFLGAVGAAIVALAVGSRLALRGRSPLFEHEAERSVQTLELG